ncbi:MAG: PqqD family peptide modification chaperone [Candidatus Solibacter sp.]
MKTAYDAVAYQTFARRQTHPDRLAAIARLFGMRPAPVTQCRVLEIGCGDAANLIPMAYHLPGSRFTGIDLADSPIAEGRRAAADLDLSNLDLRVADLCAFGEGEGEFDYIVAHGLYSWVPAPVRDRLLAVCGKLLAPEGVALVSYNVYPGRYPRQMIREILMYHIREVQDPRERIAEARKLLERLDHPEAAAMRERRDDSLFHDDLAPVNDPVWFRDFAAHAARHGMQYLGEADSHKTFSREMPRGDVTEWEQYVDFLGLRRFRQTLLCRAQVPLDRAIGPERLAGFLFSENAAGKRAESESAVVAAVAQALHDAGPVPVAFEELVPYAGSAELLREVLFGLLGTGAVNLHVHDFPCADEAGVRPRASRLARYQAARGELVTNACNVMVKLDAIAEELVQLLDGTRTREQIARDLAKRVGVPLRQVRPGVDGSLAWLAHMALLEG